jgi:hypothetical protein
MIFRMLAAVAVPFIALPAAPAVAQNRPNEARDVMRSLGMSGLQGKKLEKAVAKAEAIPLGSKANPVRENMPKGELAYLNRLRCADGAKPAVSRSGNVGSGIYGNIVDLFQVTCPGAKPVAVYMDMYHDGPETRPIPGFTMEQQTAPSA